MTLYTEEPITAPYTSRAFCIKKVVYSINDNVLTIRNGRFMLSNGVVLSEIINEDFNITTANLMLLVYNKEDSGYELVPYSSYTVKNGTCEILCQLYNNVLIGEYVELYDPSDVEYKELLSGLIFVSMQNNKFVAECSETARIQINNTAYNISSFTANISVASLSSVQCLCVNGTGFYVKTYNAITNTDLIIASYYNNNLYTKYEDKVILNTINIKQIYQKINTRYNINDKRLGYKLRVPITANQNNARDLGDFIQFVNGWNLDSKAKYIYHNNKVFRDGNINIVENTVDLSGSNILMIGDSITNRGWIQKKLSTYNSNITFVGTKETGEGIGETGYYCEGYPGWSSNRMLSSDSPFYNPVTEEFDFTYYVNTNSIYPNIVTIEFGLNEGSTSVSTFFENIQTMIDSIKEYSNTIKVYVITPFRKRIGAHDNTYGTSEDYFMLDRLRTMSCYQLTNCVIIPVWYLLNDDLDYVYTTLSANYGSITIDGCSDNIHPAETKGFEMLSNMIYGYLGL